MNNHMNFLNFHGQNLAVTSTNVREFVSGPILAVAVRENVWEPLKLGPISGYYKEASSEEPTRKKAVRKEA